MLVVETPRTIPMYFCDVWRLTEKKKISNSRFLDMICAFLSP